MRNILVSEPFAVRYPRPQRLSDPFHDFYPDSLNRLLATPDEQLSWSDFQVILGPFLPAGKYEEAVYFLPLAFEYLLKHDRDACDLFTSLAWFVSEYADDLSRDGLLIGARERLQACFHHWTSRFTVIHLDREACRKRGFGMTYIDVVLHTNAVGAGLDDLFRFRRHVDVAETFVNSLVQHNGDYIKAAWFLELARSWIAAGPFPFPDYGPLCELLADEQLLETARKVVLENRGERESSPTYWRDTFTILGLDFPRI